MIEDILKVLVKNRGIDKDGSWLINAEYNDLQVLAKKIETAINYTRCCKSDSEKLKIDKYNEPLTGKKGTDISSSVGDSLDDF